MEKQSINSSLNTPSAASRKSISFTTLKVSLQLNGISNDDPPELNKFKQALFQHVMAVVGTKELSSAFELSEQNLASLLKSKATSMSVLPTEEAAELRRRCDELDRKNDQLEDERKEWQGKYDKQ
jgi:FtsZ-binding cell division protein ZapB